jgi:hypothetical protein
VEHCLEERVNYQESAWVQEEESPDQLCMEKLLPELVTVQSRLLHIGIGSSTLARRWCNNVAGIDGVTVLSGEKAHAESLGLSNYRVFLLNKYRMTSTQLLGPYSLILDNNLSSFACCYYHFHRMFEVYSKLLSPGGWLLTQKRGMRYYQDGAFPLSLQDLKRLSLRYSLRLVKRPYGVYSLMNPPQFRY